MTESQIRRIQKDHRNESCTVAFQAALELWKSNEKAPYTWETILNVLCERSIEKNALAVAIASHLNNVHSQNVEAASLTSQMSPEVQDTHRN